MSAIAGVTGSSLTAFSYFRAVFDSSADGDPSSPASSAGDSASTPPAAALTGTPADALLNPAPAGQEAPQEAQGGHHHHHHGGGHGGVIDQIEQTVTNALQSAQDDSSADPNKLIEQALAQLFEKASASPANGNAQSGGDAADTAQGLSPAGSAGSSSAHGWGGRAAANGAFVDALQSAGIDPAQFRADFLAAIKDAQSGQANAATALQSVPPGTRLDITA